MLRSIWLDLCSGFNLWLQMHTHFNGLIFQKPIPEIFLSDQLWLQKSAVWLHLIKLTLLCMQRVPVQSQGSSVKEFWSESTKLIYPNGCFLCLYIPDDELLLGNFHRETVDLLLLCFSTLPGVDTLNGRRSRVWKKPHCFSQLVNLASVQLLPVYELKGVFSF